MEGLSLASDRLKAVFDAPGAVYRAARFDWTTQLTQLWFDGRPLLTREKLQELTWESQGVGMAGEFGLESAIGYDACPVGGWFPKIGVGRLKRPDERPYWFARAYELEPARFGARHEGQSLVFTAESEVDDWGWRLERRWTLGTDLVLETALTNTGARPWSTQEYIHNFLAAEGDWTLSAPNGWDAASFTELVNRERVLRFDGSVSRAKPATQPFFFSAGPQPSWSLVSGGVRLEEHADFPVLKCNVWGTAHVISPELYRTVDTVGGQTLRWTRRWTFTTV